MQNLHEDQEVKLWYLDKNMGTVDRVTGYFRETSSGLTFWVPSKGVTATVGHQLFESFDDAAHAGVVHLEDIIRMYQDRLHDLQRKTSDGEASPLQGDRNQFDSDRSYQMLNVMKIRRRLRKQLKFKMRQKPDPNIWYWGFQQDEGEPWFAFQRNKYCPHLSFRRKYGAYVGYDTERGRFCIRPMNDKGFRRVGWRKNTYGVRW